MKTTHSNRHWASLALTLLLATPVRAEEANPLALDAATVAEIGVVVDTAAIRLLTEELKAPGEVKADAYATTLVSARIPAHVVARKAKLGELVKAGQPLVSLSSVEVAETQGALVVAEQDWQRVASLGPEAVSARRYNEARVQRDQARAKLRAFGLSDGSVSALLRGGSSRADGTFDLLAPGAGRITTDAFLVGERVEPGRVLFTVAAGDRVWVEAQMTPADAARTDVGMDARITARGTTSVGKVVVSAAATSERTRTVPVRIEVSSASGSLRPGELVEARIAAGAGAATLALPESAIVLLSNQPTVFLARDNHRFEPVPLQVGETRDGWTVVKEGMKAGDAYAREGAFALKARLLRSQLGEE
jgi:cobalt-zinc-cadmium efflux system membrane fusion protein